MSMPCTEQRRFAECKKDPADWERPGPVVVLHAQLALETRPFRDRFVSKCLQAIAVISTNGTRLNYI